MGVAGLWEVLRPAGQVRSLTALAVEDGFNANPSHQRGFRIGIDASIWFFHAAYGREGENPELRTLFFRCCRLLQSPLLPLFVFDGPNRPAIKRGKRVGGNAHWLTQGMKNIIDAFGFEWWVAPGEAEAELAYLNRIGIIDAVLSDDVDNFLFGATMIIRNPSNNLSGNRAHPVKNSEGKDDGNHVVTYTADAVLSDPSVALSRPGTILFGVLSGGDYIPAGLPGCGQKFATGLARAGFGDSLLEAVKGLKGARLDAFLDQWRQDIRNELKTNKSGLLPSKKPSLAASLPNDFPSLPVLMSYADPLTSENMPQKRKAPRGVWRNDPDPMKIASLCELYFEWGVKDVIVHRFRTVLWPGIVCRAVRRAVVDEDVRRRPVLDGARQPDNEGDDTTVSPSSPTKCVSSAFSALALSSPLKRASASGTSTSDLSGSDSFTLSLLAPLTSPASSNSSRSTSPSSPTSTAPRRPPLLVEVLSQRAHASTDYTLEYRVLVDPTTLVQRTESGVRGLRPPLVGGLFGVDPEEEDGGTLDQDADESGSDDAIERLETAASAASKSGAKKRKARRGSPTALLRLWLPACMIRAAAPALAEAYEEKVRAREEKKAKRSAKGRRGGRAGTGVSSTSRRAGPKDTADDGDNDSVPGASSSKTAVGSKIKAKAVRIGRGGGRRKPKQVSEAQDDAYEFIDLSAGESPCSSDEEGVEEGKGKARAGQTGATKLATKANAKIDTTKKKTTATNTMKEIFNTSKPSTMRATKYKTPASRSCTAKTSTMNAVTSKYVREEEGDEGLVDVTLPPPLPKSSRPLDLLHAKSKPSIAAPNPTSDFKSKVTAVPRYEEEESSSSSPRPSGSRSNPSSLPCRPAQLATQARKKALFVGVSDSDSEIEVSDVRRPLSSPTGALAAYVVDEPGMGSGDVSVSASIRTTTTFVSEKSTNGAAGGVIDFIATGNVLKSKSVSSKSVATPLVPPMRTVSAPLGKGTIGPAPIVQSLPKLAHIIHPGLTLESEEEEGGSDGDELPTFHRGSAKSGAKETRVASARPVPRPFPMQLASGAPLSPCASRLRQRKGSRCDDADEDSGIIEFVDVFTTPSGSLPPRSPTPSHSPVKSVSIDAFAGPAAFVKSKQPGGFFTSPTKSESQADTEPHKETKQGRNTSSDRGTRASGNEENGILKSPRKSAAHSSPRHVSRARGRASSPTPFALSSCIENVASRTGGDVGRKLWPSDPSAIYISSGSEDEGDAGPGVDHDGGEEEAEMNGDEDRWADTGMILSVPPSPARAPFPATELVLTAPSVKPVPANRARLSKFKPAALKVDVRVPPIEFQASAKSTSTSLESPMHDEDIAAPHTVCRAPLLIARAKRGKGRDDDVIDLTSD